MHPFLVLCEQKILGSFVFLSCIFFFFGGGGGGSLWLGAEDVTTILNVELLRNKKSSALVETHIEQLVLD